MAVTNEPTETEMTRHGTSSMASHDVYKDVHKGLRAALFAVTGEAGRTDPCDEPALRALAEHVSTLTKRLTSHASHENKYLQPLIEEHVPQRAANVVDAHVSLEVRMLEIEAHANRITVEPRGDRLGLVHQLYLDLARYTSSYLEHQDEEERTIMPALDAALGMEALLDVHQKLVAGTPPDELAQFMALMIPAMNIDERTELLGGMRVNAPGEVFNGIWALTASVLPTDDFEALAERIGVDR